MFAPSLKTVLLTAALTISASAVQATIVTFESIAPANTNTSYLTGSSFTSPAGYLFTVNANVLAPTNQVFIMSNPQINPAYADNGTSYMGLFLGDNVTMTNTAGKLFSVETIDLGNIYGLGRQIVPGTAMLTGTYADGRTIVASYSYSNANDLSANDFTTVALSNFTDLISLTLESPVGSISVDNIVINEATVPEPASLALLGLGLAGIAALRRRKAI